MERNTQVSDTGTRVSDNTENISLFQYGTAMFSDKLNRYVLDFINIQELGDTGKI